MAERKERRCDTCIWWRARPNAYEKRGQCHLGPPSLPPILPQTAQAATNLYWGDYRGIWPVVLPDDFCGEHASRIEANVNAPNPSQ